MSKYYEPRLIMKLLNLAKAIFSKNCLQGVVMLWYRLHYIQISVFTRSHHNLLFFLAKE